MFNNSTPFSMPVVPANNGGGGFGDGSWIWAFLIFALLGNYGGGFGFGGGGKDGGCASQADVRAAVDQQTLISKLDQQTYGLADSTYAINNAITNGFHGVDNAVCNLGYNVQTGFNNISTQLAQCCCDNKAAIQDIKYTMATQACETRQAITDSTKSIIDFLVQDKLATLQAENQGLKLAASQAAQNNYLVNAIRPCPIPAYTVANPFCCTTTTTPTTTP